jgi:hypothetical protein
MQKDIFVRYFSKHNELRIPNVGVLTKQVAKNKWHPGNNTYAIANNVFSFENNKHIYRNDTVRQLENLLTTSEVTGIRQLQLYLDQPSIELHGIGLLEANTDGVYYFVANGETLQREVSNAYSFTNKKEVTEVHTAPQNNEPEPEPEIIKAAAEPIENNIPTSEPNNTPLFNTHQETESYLNNIDEPLSPKPFPKWIWAAVALAITGLVFLLYKIITGELFLTNS